MRRAFGLLALLAGLLGGGLVFATSAQAHATVVSSDPADGARLASAPALVRVSFDEPVTLGSLGYLHVTDMHGRRVDSGGAFHPDGKGSVIAVRLRAGLPNGSYVESFRIISADSHPVAGIVRFVVGSGALAAVPGGAVAATDAVTSVAFDAARWLSYAGIALLAAVWLPVTWWRRGAVEPRVRRTVWAGWGLAVVGTVLEVVLQGPYAAGDGLGSVLRASLLDGTLHTGYGRFSSARLVLLGVAAPLLALALRDAVPPGRRAGGRFAVLPVLAGIAVTFSLVGHPNTTDPRWLSVALDALHLSAMAVWIGGLVLVLAALLPRGGDAEVARVLPGFSRVAVACVAVLVATGGYAAWRGIGSWRAVLGTEYGLLVIAKVLLLAGMLALGNLARRLIARRGLDRPAGRERLRRGVVVEAGLAALVLVATAVLVDQPRGAEALAAQDRAPVSAQGLVGDGRTVTVTLDPGIHGPVAAEVDVTGGRLPQAVTVTATQPERGIGPIPVPVSAGGGGLYTASDVDLPSSGRWVFEVVLTASAFDAVTVDVAVVLH